MRLKQYPFVILFHEKHGDVVYLANNDKELYGAFKDRLNARIKEGWYSDADLEELRTESGIGWSGDVEGKRAYFFLNARDGGEHEGYEILTPIVAT